MCLGRDLASRLWGRGERIGIPKCLTGALAGGGLGSIRLMLVQMGIVGCSVLVRALALGWLRDEAAIGTFGIDGGNRGGGCISGIGAARLYNHQQRIKADTKSTYNKWPLKALPGDKRVPPGLLRRPSFDWVQIEEARDKVDKRGSRVGVCKQKHFGGSKNGHPD